MSFVLNFIVFPAVKQFSRYIKFWPSYSQLNLAHFLDTVYVVIVTKHVHRLQICAIVHAQLEGTPTIPPTYTQIRAVARDRQTHRQTHIRLWPLYISPRLCLTQNVITESKQQQYGTHILYSTRSSQLHMHYGHVRCILKSQYAEKNTDMQLFATVSNSFIQNNILGI